MHSFCASWLVSVYAWRAYLLLHLYLPSLPSNECQYLGDGIEARELQCQHEGGSCEFFLLCWMSSGLIQGSCGGFMRGCCHRTAKSANLGTSDIKNTVDLTSVPQKDYGPVINDPSECPVVGVKGERIFIKQNDCCSVARTISFPSRSSSLSSKSVELFWPL